MEQRLEEGQIVEAPFLSGQGELKSVEERPGYLKLEVLIKETSKLKTFTLSDDEVSKIETVDQSDRMIEDSEDFFLGIEASRIRLAHQFDPILAVNTAKIDPLPHQMEAVYEHALKNSPRVRFMIADDAGAGKTIMGGLLIKELQYRNLANRILVVVPGHLKYQWQREMQDKFDTNFRMINREAIRNSFSENVWEEHNQCIATIDFLKQDDILNSIKGTYWDLVVVDEAHKMAAYKYGDDVKKTDRYQAGEVLSEQSTHMLFLTATPHKGDKENFRLFLNLLRPGYFSKDGLIEKSIQQGDNPVFIRRLKEDLRDFDGSKIFPPRHVKTAKFRLTDAERNLYDGVTRYVQDYYDQAKEKRHIGFAMMILQRRLTSSTNAILESLKTRKDKLHNLMELPEKIQQSEEYDEVLHKSDEQLEEEMEEMEEEKRWELEQKLTNLTIANNLEDVEAEIEQVDDLIERAEQVKEQGIENKLKKLREEVLEELRGRKLLIFTEFKDTLEYLVEKLNEWGYSTTQIEGGMGMDERVDAEKEFEEEKQIMVATEAAGEGINLQFCSLMVNYDIPWNPTRLEQRMGRIHRYGQEDEVYIWNIISQDTREGQILSKLFTKLERMRKDLGTDRVFDIIGDVTPGTDFGEMFKDAIFNQQKMDEIYEDLDRTSSDRAEELVEKATAEGLATKHLNYTGMEKLRMKAKENRLVPEYIKDYFLRAFNKLDGGEVKQVRDYYRIESVPYELRQYNQNEDFRDQYGEINKLYKKVTFDKETADKEGYEQITPGHPLLEALNRKTLSKLENPGSFALFADSTGKLEGTLWFYKAEIEDGAGDIAGKKLFCLHQSPEGEIEQVNPSVLWDLDPKNPEEVEELDEDLENYKDSEEPVQDYLVNNLLFPYKDELAEEREEEAKIKKQYGLKSLDYLISESNEKLLEYDEKLAEGEDYDMAIRREQKRLERLERKREELEEEIENDTNLKVSKSNLKGKALVIQEKEETKSGGKDMATDEAIEKVGMEVTEKYEKKNGWKPEDVSEENLGFDVRSIKYTEDGSVDGKRYIEVKARAREGGVRLSANEWKKAKRFGDEFWLYVVMNAGTNSPELQRINDPADRFSLEEDIYATGYKIPKENLKEV